MFKNPSLKIIYQIFRARQMPMPPRFAVNKTGGGKSPTTTHTSSSSSSSEESGSGSSESSESSGSESSSEEGGSPRHKKQGLSPDKLAKKGANSKVCFHHMLYLFCQFLITFS